MKNKKSIEKSPNRVLNALHNINASAGGPRRIIIAAVLLGACFIAVIAGFVCRDKDTVITEDVAVEKVEMKSTVTAAGEVVAAESEDIEFSSSKTFAAMCVETNEIVKKGQHLIKYSDGTYEDAPADGVIIAINAPEVGNVGGSSYTITFANSKKLALKITVPEGEINSVKKGDDVEIVVNSDTSKTYTGKITSKLAISTTMLSEATSDSTSAEASGGTSDGAGNSGSSKQGGMSGAGSQSPFGSDSKTAYYTVTLEFNNDGNILLGTGAICTITISDREDVMAVPVEAVQFDDDGKAYVEVVNSSGTEQVEVEVGDSDADYAEITKGLDGDETVRISRKG